LRFWRRDAAKTRRRDACGTLCPSLQDATAVGR